MFYRRLYRSSDLDQVLLTIGLAFMSVAAAAYFFGTSSSRCSCPPYLRGCRLLGFSLGIYRLFLIGVALVVTLALVLALEYTRFGARFAPRSTTSAWRAASASTSTALRGHLRARQRTCRPWRRARDRHRRPRSDFRADLSGLCAHRRLGRRARLDRRLVRRGDPARHQRRCRQILCSAIGAFMIYLVMVALLMWRPAGLFGKR